MTRLKSNFYFSVLLALILFNGRSYGQLKGDSVTTHFLKEVIVHGNYQEYLQANQTVRVSRSATIPDQLKSLNTLISEQSSVYFKNYGNGMLSTIALRGTTSSQTTTFWNGVNINYPFLGQFDFSLAPTLSAAEVSVIPGGASAVFGSDAIGGSIMLESAPLNDKTVSFTQQIGSFRTFNSSLNVNLASSKLRSVTNVYINTSKNDFTYENYTLPGSPEERQDHASYLKSGIVQDFYLTTSSNSLLKINLWFNYADREIQPSIVSASRDTQEDTNTRVNLAYNLFDTKSGNWNFQLANINDQLVFNQSQVTNSNQLSSIIENEIGFNNWKIRSGWNTRFYTLDGNNYESRENEFRSDLYLLSVWEPAERVTINVNLRQSFYPEGTAPFTPSAGINWNFLSRNLSRVNLKAQVSRNFRYPTLNDRYWYPGGNSDIVPEDGVTLESTIEGLSESNQNNLNWNLTLYRTWINNMIVWLPAGSFWSPVNFRSVDIYGIEPTISWKYEWGKGKNIHLRGSYSYVRSINRSVLDEFDRSENKQLPYTPIHNLNLAQTFGWNSWSIRFIEILTGEQYSTFDNEESLDPFLLINFQIGKSIPIKKSSLVAGFEINNLLNTQYQQLRNRPMPGRNFMITISFNI